MDVEEEVVSMRAACMLSDQQCIEATNSQQINRVPFPGCPICQATDDQTLLKQGKRVSYV